MARKFFVAEVTWSPVEREKGAGLWTFPDPLHPSTGFLSLRDRRVF